MKNIIFALLLASSTNVMAASHKHFTALGNGENSIYVSLKSRTDNHAPMSSLFEITDKSKKEIKLSEEIKEREIVGIFLSKKRLFIISQMTTEQGDNPIVYENVKNKWNKIVEIDCKNFSKIEILKNDLSVFCEHETENKISNETKMVSIKNMNIEKKITIPQLEINDNKINAKLEGSPFEWDKVKIGDNKLKILSVNDF